MLEFLSLSDTRIGAGLAASRRAQGIVTLLFAGVVLLDVLIARFYFVVEWRFVLAAVAYLTAAIAAAEIGDSDTFGLRLTPRQGWTFWWKAAGIAALFVGLILAVAGSIVFLILKYEIPPGYRRSFEGPEQIVSLFLGMCVAAPLFEEAIYRLAFCPAATVWLGPKWCLIANGLLFAYLHSIYGNPSPENLVGGFILAWAYLKSGTILVPLTFHAGPSASAFRSIRARNTLAAATRFPESNSSKLRRSSSLNRTTDLASLPIIRSCSKMTESKRVILESTKPVKINRIDQ